MNYKYFNTVVRVNNQLFNIEFVLLIKLFKFIDNVDSKNRDTMTGQFIARKMVDEMQYERVDGRNVLHMTKGF